MVSPELRQSLPTSAELPCSDDTPVDDEDQNLLPNVLLFLLNLVWRDRHQPFEVYKLVNGSYQLQIGEPYWMPEINLGLGRFPVTIGGEEKEALVWCDRLGQRYLTAEELAEQQRQRADAEQQRAETERQRADQLAARLRELGIDPDTLS
jgi:hypothetical protein